MGVTQLEKIDPISPAYRISAVWHFGSVERSAQLAWKIPIRAKI